MSTINTAQFGSDDEDVDFQPALKDVHQDSASEVSSDESESGTKRKKKRRRLSKDADLPAVIPEPHITKEAIEDLWTSFNEPAATSSTSLEQDGSKLVTIKKQFKFAGDVIEQSVQVREDSEDAIAYFNSLHPPAESIADTREEPLGQTSTSRLEPPSLPSEQLKEPPVKKSIPAPTRRKGGLASLQAKLANGKSTAKPRKLTTLEKSKYDWEAHVAKEGLKEDLDAGRKSSLSFMEKQAFLDRAEQVREEQYAKLKSKRASMSLRTASANASNGIHSEVDETISRISALAAVKGVLILQRSTGTLLKSAGTLFTPSATLNTDESMTTASEGQDIISTYSELCWELVQNASATLSHASLQEECKFLRLRLKKYEWLITPDPQYILLVIQDPSHSD